MFNLSHRTIVRRGDMTFRVRGAHHCGTNDYIKAGVLAAKWVFTVVCEPKLDNRGFLFDQNALATWVQHECANEAFDSCEMLSSELAEKFCRHVTHENPHVVIREITVTVMPDPFMSEISSHFVLKT